MSASKSAMESLLRRHEKKEQRQRRRLATSKKSCYLYVIMCVEETEASAFKVGISHDPQARLQGVQTGNPKELFVALEFLFKTRQGAAKAESYMHSRLVEFSSVERLVGEWFISSRGLNRLIEVFNAARSGRHYK